MNSNSTLQNSPCEKIQQKPGLNSTDEGPVDNTYRVLPLFELEARKAKGIQTYSLKNNERLAKDWRNRIKKLNEELPEKHLRTFPDISDYHFKNCRTQFLPSLSQKNFPRPHLHLTPGPGTDKYGERPIPVEFTMRRFQTANQNNATRQGDLKKTRMLKTKTDFIAEPAIHKY